MSRDASPDHFETRFGHDDDIGVRFPPGLGLIPPRELARVPRPRRAGEPWA